MTLQHILLIKDKKKPEGGNKNKIHLNFLNFVF